MSPDDGESWESHEKSHARRRDSLYPKVRVVCPPIITTTQANSCFADSSEHPCPGL